MLVLLGDEHMVLPEHLYHYTSIETLALILKHRTLCLNSLLAVDDINEAETKDMANFGKYVYVSCWTDDSEESVSLWSMYTPNMHGVRIRLAPYPFKTFHYAKGSFLLSEDVETHLNLEKIYSENKGTIVSNQPRLWQVIYDDDKSHLYPKIRNGTLDDVKKFLQAKDLSEIAPLSVTYSLHDLGKYKSSHWAFQKEWRYIMFISPMGQQEMIPSIFKQQQELIRRLEDPNQSAPYDRFFIDIDEKALSQAEIVLGPRMSEAEKELVIALLEKHGLGTNWKESSLRIR